MDGVIGEDIAYSIMENGRHKVPEKHLVDHRIEKHEEFSSTIVFLIFGKAAHWIEDTHSGAVQEHRTKHDDHVIAAVEIGSVFIEQRSRFPPSPISELDLRVQFESTKRIMKPLMTVIERITSTKIRTQSGIERITSSKHQLVILGIECAHCHHRVIG